VARSGIVLIAPDGVGDMLAGTSHAANLIWSPNGRQIAFAGYYGFGSLSFVATSGNSSPVVWFALRG
jgi:hypothetical protein